MYIDWSSELRAADYRRSDICSVKCRCTVESERKPIIIQQTERQRSENSLKCAPQAHLRKLNPKHSSYVISRDLAVTSRDQPYARFTLR